MIAKRITSKAAKPRMARLVKYMVAAEGKLDPRSWTRTADYVLCSAISTRGEKVGGVRVTNCNTDDPAAATTLIEVTQAANTRSKTDKTYHLVFSFPPGEEPDLKTLHAIEDQLCASIGYADHQRISAVHIDTDHLHVHVAINKVHPKGLQNIEPYFDKKKLMEACERIELEYGLTRTNHGLTGQEPKSKVKERQAQAEAHSGIETITGFVTRDIAPRLKEAKDWKHVHAILAEHGLEIKPRGAGMVIGSGDAWVKASSCDRALSFKALTDKLGPFEKGAKRKETARAYEPKPRQEHPSSARLYEQYRQQQSNHRAIREYGLDRLKYDGQVLEVNLQKWKKAQRAMAKIAAKGPTRRAMLKMIRLNTAATRSANKRAIAAQRQQILSQTAMPSWAVWLSNQTEMGNTEALDILRQRGVYAVIHGNSLTAEKTEKAKTIILKGDNLRAGTNGVLVYGTNDGGVVCDRKTYVQATRTTAGSTQLALELAAERFKGQVLIVEGSEQFKQDVARLASAQSIQVRFSDPAMERGRKAASPPHQQSKGKEAEL